MPKFTPLPVPTIAENQQPQPPHLSDEEEKKRQEVLAHFDKDDYRLPEEEKGDLTDEEKMWLSNDCILRYLRATKWQSTAAVKRLEETLKWRRSFGIYDERQSAEHVEPEALTGKEILYGFDKKGRPAFYMIPSRQNTTEGERQIQFAVWMMERCIDLMGPGVETLDLLINFGDRGKNPSLSVARQVLNIIQSHYPERLGLALIINVPMIVNMFFKVIMPFVDPVTRNKVKFNPRVIEDGIFDKEQIMTEWWGGDQDFVYDHGKYWPELIKMSEERRKMQMQRWSELGGKIGTSEWDMKTGWPTAPPPVLEPEKITERVSDTSVIPVQPEATAE